MRRGGPVAHGGRPAPAGIIASRNGRATAVPRPRSTVRLEIRPPSLMTGLLVAVRF